jgi:ribulose-5-phosphate 4-epimerase/fuculose-1-phosphate aldolase
VDVSLSEEKHLINTARLLYTSGLNKSCQAVLAARNGERDVILVTAAKSDFKSIDYQDLHLVSLTGDTAEDASPEELPGNLNYYLKVFEDRLDVAALAHLYPPCATIFADKAQLYELSQNPAHAPVREFIKVECRECPSRFTGLCSCRSDIRKSYTGADALLIKGDGIIVLAADLDSLYHKVESLEWSAQKHLSSDFFKPIC